MASGEIYLGDVFGDAWQAFRRHPASFIGACLYGLVPFLLYVGLVGLGIYAHEEGWIDAAWGLALEYAANAGLAVASQVVLLGFTRMSLAGLRGQPVAAADVFDAGGALVPGLVSALIVKLLVFVGLCLCFVPAIIVSCATAFTHVFVVDKGLLPLAAIRASVAATRGRRLTVAAVWTVGVVLVIVGALALGVGVLVAIPVFGLAVAALYERLWAAARPDA